METVKVYLTPPKVASPSLTRVTNALIKHKPGHVQIVDDQDQADLTILHVIGRQDKVAQKAREVGRYAVIQYALKSTLRPKAKSWLPLWKDAQVVWSYYDLNQICKEEDIDPTFNFYYAPLGIDDAFEVKTDDKKYTITTTGQSYLTESVRECILASRQFDFPTFHLGQDLKMKGTTCHTGITDERLAWYYSRSYYVSGLRRVEGFELPVIEGLVCGARPIVFDMPHYRAWFEDFAVFIPENTREKVIESLISVFEEEYRPVTQKEIEMARKKFNWHHIITNFWEKIV